MAGHRIARHCRCFIVRIKLDIETNIHHILKSCTHLTKGTRLNTISQVCWMRHFYSATNGCFIFDLVIKHRINADLIRYLWIRPYWNSINPKFFPRKCKIVPKRYNIKPNLVTDFVVIATKSNINFFAITCFLQIASLSNNRLFQSTYRRQYPTPLLATKTLQVF